jgi:hypothetical protein
MVLSWQGKVKKEFPHDPIELLDYPARGASKTCQCPIDNPGYLGYFAV